MNEPTVTPIADAPVASTPDSPSASDRLASASPADVATWRQTGTLPGAPAVSAQGDGDPGGDPGDGEERHEAEPPVAAPAGPVDPAASAAGKALAKHSKLSLAQQKINDLARKNYILEGRLHAFEQQSSPRPAADAAPPVAAQPPASASDAAPVKPKIEDFATIEDYIDAATDYRVALAQAADRQARTQDTQQQQYAQVVTEADARITAFAAAHPDYLDVINGQTEVRPTPLLLEAVTHSELNAAIAYHLCSHPDEYRALVALAPGPMLKALGRLEQRLESASPAAVAPPPPKHVTTAPAPPVTLGSRPALPADDAKAAVARGDYATFKRTENARELAARK